MTHVTCSLCGNPAREIAHSYPGYKIPTSYGIWECGECGLQFADPMRSDPDLYDEIYRSPALMPGYDRYYNYAKAVARSKKPMEFLANSMEPYWAVRAAIQGLPKGAKILDIGSGLGYLAYALADVGYDTVGLDISENAVGNARTPVWRALCCRRHVCVVN